jgi:hypothetical protein
MARTSPPKPPEPEIRIVDNPGAPEVFANGVIGAFLNNGNIHITLGSRRCDYSRQPNVFTDVVIGRLVIPFAAAENAVQFLADFMERMKQIAADPSSSAPRTLQ